jgi:hypothetical protein
MSSAVTFNVFSPVNEDGLGGEGMRFDGTKLDLAAIQFASASLSDSSGSASIIH